MLQLIKKGGGTHRFPARFVAVLLSVAQCIGCSVSDGSNKPNRGSDGAGGEAGSEVPPNHSESSLNFESQSVLALRPNEVATLKVEVSPPNSQTVTFDILSDDAAFDGFLLEATAVVGSDGTASVDLQAPSQAAIFVVRASIGAELEATQTISVSESYGDLLVSAGYAGPRNIERWTVSARTGTSCDEIESYFVDGPLTATGSGSLSLKLVPTGVTVAVTLRGDQLVSGCITLEEVKPGEQEEIVIDVTARPVNVDFGTLDLDLEVESLTSTFATHVNEAVTLARATFRATETDDAEALILRMQRSLEADERSEFETSNLDGNFVELTRRLFGDSNPVSEGLTELLESAASSIPRPATFRGTLALAGLDSQFGLEEVTGLLAEEAGFNLESTWQVSAAATETVVVGGSLTYQPLRWLTQLSAANRRIAMSTSPVAHLAEQAKCPELALELISSSGGPTHGACEFDCVNELCAQTITEFWNEELPLAGKKTKLLVAGSGDVDVNGPAHIDSISGTWIGVKEDDETSLSGALRAQASR